MVDIIKLYSQIWSGIGWCTTSRITRILRRNDSTKSRPTPYNEKRRHLLLYEHYKRGEFSVRCKSKSNSNHNRSTERGWVNLNLHKSTVNLINFVNSQSKLQSFVFHNWFWHTSLWNHFIYTFHSCSCSFIHKMFNVWNRHRLNQSH